jgi:hypothetical protein
MRYKKISAGLGILLRDARKPDDPIKKKLDVMQDIYFQNISDLYTWIQNQLRHGMYIYQKKIKINIYHE